MTATIASVPITGSRMLLLCTYWPIIIVIVIVMHISDPSLLLLLCTYSAHSFHGPLHDFALGKLPPGRQNGSHCSHPMDVNGGAEAGAGCNRNNSGIIRGPFTSSSPELCQNGGTLVRGPIPQKCANGKREMGATVVVLYTDGNINCMRQANEASGNSI